jgi:multidrug resistance efflux pump
MAAVAAAVVLVAAVAAGRSPGRDIPPQTVPVQRGTVVTSVSADGSLEAPQELALSFEGAGRIVAVEVREGQRVRRGQVLARLQGTTQRAQLGSAEANLDSARSRLVETSTGLTPTELALRRRDADQSLVALRNARRDLADARRVADSNVTGLRSAVARARVTGEEADLRVAELRLAEEEAELERRRRYLNAVNQRSNHDRAELYGQLDRLRDAQNQDPPDQEEANDAQYRIEVQRSKIAAEELEVQRANQNVENTRQSVQRYIQDVDRARSTLRDARRRLGDATDNLRNGIATARQQVDAAGNALATSQAQLQVTLARNRVDQQVKAADVAAGIAAVEQAQAGLEEARKAVDDTVLRAPADGVVGHLNAEVGEQTGGTLAGASPMPLPGTQALAAGSPGAPGAPGAQGAGGQAPGAPVPPSRPGGPSQPGEPLMTLAQTGSLQVKAGFDESDAAHLHTGDRATVTVDALPDRRFGATVASIDPIERVQSSVVTYEVTLVLDGDPRELRPGMSASADVAVAQVDGALTVPRTAVRSPQGANPSVIVVRPDGRDEVRMVATGLQGATRVQILAGVGLGERVRRAIAPPPDVG